MSSRIISSCRLGLAFFRSDDCWNVVCDHLPVLLWEESVCSFVYDTDDIRLLAIATLKVT